MTRKTKNYLVTYRVVGEQTTWVTATSAKEAKKKAVIGKDVDPVDFIVRRALPSTAEIENVQDNDPRCSRTTPKITFKCADCGQEYTFSNKDDYAGCNCGECGAPLDDDYRNLW